MTDPFLSVRGIINALKTAGRDGGEPVLHGIEAVKRYIFAEGVRRGTFTPYAGPLGPTPTEEEFPKLLDALLDRAVLYPFADSGSLQEFRRADLHRLAECGPVAWSGFVPVGRLSEVEWDRAAARADDSLNRLKTLVLGPAAGLAKKRQSTNDARDEFCYEQKTAGKTLREIRERVNSQPSWEPLDSEQGVSQAAKRYAERHGKPWPI